MTSCRRCSRNGTGAPASAAWNCGEYMAVTASGLRLAHAAAQALTAPRPNRPPRALRAEKRRRLVEATRRWIELGRIRRQAGMTMPPSRVVHCRARLRASAGVAGPALSRSRRCLLQGLLVPQPVSSTARASAGKSEAGERDKAHPGTNERQAKGRHCSVPPRRRAGLGKRGGRAIIYALRERRTSTWSSSHRWRGAPRRTNMPVPALMKDARQPPAVPVGRADLHVPVGASLVAIQLPVFLGECAEMQHAGAEPGQVAQRRCGLARAEVLHHVVADHEVERFAAGQRSLPTPGSSRASGTGTRLTSSPVYLAFGKWRCNWARIRPRPHPTSRIERTGNSP